MRQLRSARQHDRTVRRLPLDHRCYSGVRYVHLHYVCPYILFNENNICILWRRLTGLVSIASSRLLHAVRRAAKTPLNEKSNWCDVVRDLHRGDERRARSFNGCCSSAFFSFHPRRLIIVIFNPSVWLECDNCVPVIRFRRKKKSIHSHFFFLFVHVEIAQRSSHHILSLDALLFDVK